MFERKGINAILKKIEYRAHIPLHDAYNIAAADIRRKQFWWLDNLYNDVDVSIAVPIGTYLFVLFSDVWWTDLLCKLKILRLLFRVML